MEMYVVIAVLLLITALYLMAIRCRAGKRTMQQLRNFHYAHRGLHGNGIPENSMAAFRGAKEQGYGIELDLHLLKDGGIAVIHDSSLKRTTEADGRVEDLTTAELKNYKLEGTEETIPVFSDVLKLFEGGAPLIVELKPEGKNHALLAEAACNELDKYNVTYCIESFDPRCLMWLKKNRPEVLRGQLSQNFLKTNSKLSWITKFLLTHMLINFATVPDFVAYQFTNRRCSLSNFLCIKLWRAQGVAWTVRDPKLQKEVLTEGWISIFEYFKP